MRAGLTGQAYAARSPSAWLHKKKVYFVPKAGSVPPTPRCSLGIPEGGLLGAPAPSSHLCRAESPLGWGAASLRQGPGVGGSHLGTKERDAAEACKEQICLHLARKHCLKLQKQERGGHSHCAPGAGPAQGSVASLRTNMWPVFFSLKGVGKAKGKHSH